MNVLKFNLQISNTKQGDCSDYEVDPDVESSLPEQPTPGQVLHIDSADAQRLTGSLMNDFCREIVQVCKNLEFRVEFRIPIKISLTTQKVVEPLRKVTHLLKITEYSTQSGNTGPSQLLYLLHLGTTAELPTRLFTCLLQEVDGSPFLFQHSNPLGKYLILPPNK